MNMTGAHIKRYVRKKKVLITDGDMAGVYDPLGI